jgi:polysaccharide biosynthesis transport protein
VAPETANEELSLREYVDVLRRRRLVVVLVTVVVAGAALLASLLQTPVYSATAEVLLRARSTEGIFDPSGGQRIDPQRAIQTEIRILRSAPIADAVREKLGYEADISASAAGQTDIILVTAESTDPQRAAEIANTYASTYIELKQRQIVDEFLAAVDHIQSQIDDLQRQIDSATSEAARLTLTQRKTNFEATRDELRLDAQIRTGGAQQVSQAQVPTDPVRPQPVRTGIIAFTLGLLLGVGLAFLIEFLDDTVKTKTDLERLAPTLPLLGLIPTLPAWKDRQETRLISVTDPNSPSAEAYRTLRTAVHFLGMDRPVQMVQLTSPSASEGKTTTLANLAVAMARAGRRVVVVCCDLRRPRVHDFFGLDNEVGFTSVLLGEVSLANALQPVPGVDRLQVLASGVLPPNPSELLSSRRATELLQALRADGTLVLVDSPPVLPVTDGLVVSTQVDATLLVAIAGGTTRKEAARAIELLRQVNAPLAGTILNGVTEEGRYGYSYGYYQSQVGMNGNGAANGSRARARRKRASKRR